MCHKRKDNKGYFSKVCQSIPAHSSGVQELLVTNIVSTTSPKCLSKAVLVVKINGVTINALIDTGSSQSFVNAGKQVEDYILIVK